MKTITVGVLRGGPSSEYEISLKTGENVLSALGSLSHKYSVKDILLARNGDWYFNRQFSSPEKIFRSIDVVFNGLHGYFGEDGKVQQILEHFNIPYTGSGVFASSLGMNKILSRDIFVKAGLNIPRGMVVDKDNDIVEAVNKIFKTFSPPWVIGNFIIYKFDDLMKVLEFQKGPRIFVEEYIRGKEATCGVIEDFRGQEHYSLPVIEIIPSSKYSGQSREICPANFGRETKDKIEEMAGIAHRALGCRHYSRQDFRISERAGERGKVYLLEVNTLPGLTTESLILKAVEAVGSSYSEFLDHIITLALTDK